MSRNPPIKVTERLEIYRSEIDTPRGRAVLLAGIDRASPLAVAPIVHATLTALRRGALLHFIEVSTIARGHGLGMAMLEAIVDIYDHIEAAWMTTAGQGLANAYQRTHGARDEWKYLVPALPGDPAHATPQEIEALLFFAAGSVPMETTFEATRRAVAPVDRPLGEEPKGDLAIAAGPEGGAA